MNKNKIYGEVMDRPGSFSSSWVSRLIFLNGIIYLLQGLASSNGNFIPIKLQSIYYYFGLMPAQIIEKGFIWQLFSYMFLHGGFFHIFFNMYALLIFGIPIEQAWGSKRFLRYYLFTGVGAGITIFILNSFTAYFSLTIGASGAVFGLLLAFGILYPDAEILLFFFLPIKAKFLVILYGAVELYLLISASGESNISHIGHLGGILFGLIYFIVIKKRGIKFKRKMFKAKIDIEKHKRDSKVPVNLSDNKTILLNILQKVIESGPASLTDDEYQHLKYIDIMASDNTEYEARDDFNIKDVDSYENPELEILNEIKKYI